VWTWSRDTCADYGPGHAIVRGEPEPRSGLRIIGVRGYPSGEYLGSVGGELVGHVALVRPQGRGRLDQIAEASELGSRLDRVGLPPQAMT
jgi:hypothetical protein